MSENRQRSLTERVTVNFSPAQLERLERYLQRYSENLGRFIRRAALEKLDQLGIPAEKEGFGDLVSRRIEDTKLQILNDHHIIRAFRDLTDLVFGVRYVMSFKVSKRDGENEAEPGMNTRLAE